MSRPVVAYDDRTLTMTVNGVPFDYGFFEHIGDITQRSGARPAWPVLVVDRGADDRIEFQFLDRDGIDVLVAERNERAARA